MKTRNVLLAGAALATLAGCATYPYDEYPYDRAYPDGPRYSEVGPSYPYPGYYGYPGYYVAPSVSLGFVYGSRWGHRWH